MPALSKEGSLTRVQVVIDKALLNKLDEYIKTKARGLNRSQAIKQAIVKYLEGINENNK